MEGAEVFFAVTAKELHVAKGLGAFVFNSKTSVSVLDIVGGGDDIVGDLEKF